MDGILIAKKEKGCSSNYVVRKVKKITNRKVGHIGTLDPMATGVLPLLLGNGTKLSKYLIVHDKVYEATIKLGQKTDTADTEGHVIEEKQVDKTKLTRDNITKILNSMIGKQMQRPPIYSAIKIDGKKLYEYARNNEEVEIPEREIEIYEIELIDYSVEDGTINYRVHCSKGTYIRTLCETIAEKLGTVGYMKELNRTRVGEFTIEQAITLEEIEKSWKEYIITIEEFLKDKPKVNLTEVELGLFLNGAKLPIEEENNICRIYNQEDKFIGVGIIENKLLKRDIVVY